MGRQQVGVEVGQHLFAEEANRLHIRRVLEVAHEEHPPPLRERYRRCREFLAVGHDMHAVRRGGQVADQIFFLGRNREHGVGRSINADFPGGLGGVAFAEQLETRRGGPQDPPRIPQEVQVARVHDDSRVGRHDLQDRDQRLGEGPEAQDRDVILGRCCRTPNVFLMLGEAESHGHALISQQVPELFHPLRAAGNARHLPAGIPQEADEMKQPPRVAVEVWLRHVVGADQRPLRLHGCGRRIRGKRTSS
jgi:hypothetical protein